MSAFAMVCGTSDTARCMQMHHSVVSVPTDDTQKVKKGTMSQKPLCFSISIGLIYF
jgi:hypothetical protein